MPRGIRVAASGAVNGGTRKVSLAFGSVVTEKLTAMPAAHAQTRTGVSGLSRVGPGGWEADVRCCQFWTQRVPRFDPLCCEAHLHENFD